MRQEIEDFLNHLSTEKGFSSNTIEAYRNDLYQLARFIEGQSTGGGFAKKWESTDRNLLISYIIDLKERGYASATVARKVAAVAGVPLT